MSEFEFNEDENQFVKPKRFRRVRKIYGKVRGFFSKFSLSEDKMTFRFLGTVGVITLIVAFLVTNSFILPKVIHKEPIYIPSPTLNPAVSAIIEVSPLPNVQVSVTPVPTVKPFNDVTPVPISKIHHGIIGSDIGDGSIAPTPTSAPLTPEDYSKMKASESNMVYTDNLALNIYQSDLGKVHYHVGDVAKLHLVVYNRMNEPCTNLKAYVTVKGLSSGQTLLTRMPIADLSVNLPVNDNYGADYTLTIPNYKGAYGLTLEVDGNGKRGFGLYWEIDIL